MVRHCRGNTPGLVTLGFSLSQNVSLLPAKYQNRVGAVVSFVIGSRKCATRVAEFVRERLICEGAGPLINRAVGWVRRFAIITDSLATYSKVNMEKLGLNYGKLLCF